MKRLQLRLDQGQYAIFQGILDSEGIEFSTINEQFSSLYPGVHLGAFQIDLMVKDEDYNRVQDLLKEFLESGGGEIISDESEPE